MNWTTLLMCIIVLLLIVSCSSACNDRNNPHKYKDEFYNGDYDFDVKRLPLVKPYVALNSPVNPETWRAKLYRENIPFTLSANGELFYVSSKFIVIACTNKCSFDGLLTDSVIYLMTPKDSLEYAFKTRGELDLKIDSQFGVRGIELKGFSTVYEQYHKTGKLPWLADDN